MYPECIFKIVYLCLEKNSRYATVGTNTIYDGVIQMSENK